jgi:hypothetical protein
MYKEVNYLLQCVRVINMAFEVKLMIMYIINFIFYFSFGMFISYSLSCYVLFMNLFAFSYHYDYVLISQKS